MTEARKPVIDHDHHAADYADRSLEMFAGLRKSPIAWSSNYGGYWVITRHEDILTVFRNHDIYSSAVTFEDDGSRRGGTNIPEPAFPGTLIPTEMDPPLWNDYRRPLVAMFSPKEVETFRPSIEEFTAQAIDDVIESGECDLVYDLANPVPANTMFAALGLPIVEWQKYVVHLHNLLASPHGSSERAEAEAAVGDIHEELLGIAHDRRKRPRSDLASKILTIEVQGSFITEKEAADTLFNLTLGGVETTTMLLSNIYAYLGQNPEARAYLAEDRSRLPRAIEEFLRWSSPIQSLARTVTRATNLGGQDLAVGDRVLIHGVSANHDEAVFGEAEKCILDRYPNRHLGFGAGIHRCLGSHLARAEVEIILWQTLTRLGDFTIDYPRASRYADTGSVSGWVRLPCTFTPGSRTLQDAR